MFRLFLGPLLAALASIALGRLALRFARVQLHRQEEWVLGFIAGSACLSVLVAAMGTAHQARKGAFVGLTAIALAVALWRARKPAPKPLPPLPWSWVALCAAVFTAFGALYLAHALEPQAAGGERLEQAFREWQERRLLAFPDGMRMLFLFAYAFARESAGLVHLLFLFALALAVLCYGRRCGSPAAGAFAAILVFTAPVAGVAATAPLDDLALACALFGIFYLLEVRRGLALCGLLAVFALSVRHTLPEALVFRSPRELALWGTETGGLLGPVFLLAPLGLLALRHPKGRMIVPVAAVLAIAGAADARWMIPALPFLALAMGIGLERSRGALAVLAMAAALFAWPSITAVYAGSQAWRIEAAPPVIPEPRGVE